MTIKLNSLKRWRLLEPKAAITFKGVADVERRVRLNVNLESVTTLFVGSEKQQQLLCTAGPGVETIEFNMSGDFNVFAEAGSGRVHYQSADLEEAHVEIPDPEIFTRIAQRRHRNPELEEMMYRMQLNTERRLAQQAEEIKAAFDARMMETLNARTTDTPTKTDGAGSAPVPTQSPDGESALPSEPAAASGGVTASADTTAATAGAGAAT